MDAVELVVAAVALGASAGVENVASAAVTDAYGRLKRLLGAHAIDVSAVERKPTSTTQRDALVESLADADCVDEEMVAAARQVTEAVDAEQPAAAEIIGVDLTSMRMAFLNVRNVSSTGSGVRAADLTVDGGVDISDVRAGRPAQNPDPSER